MSETYVLRNGIVKRLFLGKYAAGFVDICSTQAIRRLNSTDYGKSGI